MARLRSATDVLITCEHGGNRVPPQYRARLAALNGVLQSHRAFDAGALLMARDLARALDAPLVYSTVTRLLVDLNRSIGHRCSFSEATSGLAADERARILHQWYRPYRNEVEKRVQAAVRRGKTLVHISSHSFVPVLDGDVRNADIGLLYDPKRVGEARLARLWQHELADLMPSLTIRRNYPYRGYHDGFTTHLRRCFPPQSYIGLELEINQALMATASGGWRNVRAGVVTSLRAALAALSSGALRK